jgi:hypothetical protein
MKKLIYLIIAIVILGLIASGCFLTVVPPTEKDEITSLTKAKPLKPPSGAHYNLNIIGKKWDWNGGGSYDNENRHTMFVPEDIDEFKLNGTSCYTPMGTPSDAPPGADYNDPRPDYPGITIWMTKGDDYAVIDGNAFDDCKCEFQLATGTYEVWIVAKAKPAKKDEPEYYTDITGWVRYIDPDTGLEYVACDLGTLRVKKKLGWQDATDLFYFEGMWLFDYLEMLETPIEDDGFGATDTAYFWQYDNHGNKLVKVRFYKK